MNNSYTIQTTIELIVIALFILGFIFENKIAVLERRIFKKILRKIQKSSSQKQNSRPAQATVHTEKKDPAYLKTVGF